MSNTQSVVNLTDGRQVLLSYGVPVAAFIPADYCPYDADCKSRGIYCEHCKDMPRGYIKTARKYSVTTSKHANAFAGDRATVLEDSEFCKLIAPIEAKR
jgi:hypothetical protein